MVPEPEVTIGPAVHNTLSMGIVCTCVFKTGPISHFWDSTGSSIDYNSSPKPLTQPFPCHHGTVGPQITSNLANTTKNPMIPQPELENEACSN